MSETSSTSSARGRLACARAAAHVVASLGQRFGRSARDGRLTRSGTWSLDALERRVLLAINTVDIALKPLLIEGTRSYGATNSATLDASTGDVTQYRVTLANPLQLTADIVQPGVNLRTRLRVLDETGNTEIAAVAATSAGQPVMTPTLTLAAGTYLVEAEAIEGAGRYTVDLRTAGAEAEDFSGAGNDTPAAAQTIVPIPINGSAGLSTTVGSTQGLQGDDYYRVHLDAGQHAGVYLDGLLGGYGQFEDSAIDSSLAARGTRAIAAGDLDGDGRTDLVTVGYPDNTWYAGRIAVLYNNGDGTYTKDAFNRDRDLTDVVVADFNNDGRLDYAVVGIAANPATDSFAAGDGFVEVFINVGGRDFVTAQRHPMDDRPYTLAAGDFDNDGVIDIAVGELSTDQQVDGDGHKQTPGVITILHGRGDGGFDDDVPTVTDHTVRDIVAADVDGDGVPEVVSAEANTESDDEHHGAVGVYRVDPDNLDLQRLAYHYADSPVLSVGVVTLDSGSQQIVALRSGEEDNSDHFIQIYLNSDGTEAYGYENGFGGTPFGDTAKLVTGDFNRDGKTDVAVSVGATDGQHPYLHISTGDGNGSFSGTFDASGVQDATAVAVADMNGDGDLDLITAAANPSDDSGGPLGIGLGRGELKLDVRGPDGAVRYTGGQYYNSFDRTVPDFAAPVSGEYVIRVSGDQDTRYALTVSTNGVVGIESDDNPGTLLSAGETYAGHLDNGDTDKARVVLQAGDHFTADFSRAISPGDYFGNPVTAIVGTIALVDSTGATVASVNYTNASAGAANLSFTVPAGASGTYTVVMTASSGVGDYALRVAGQTGLLPPAQPTFTYPDDSNGVVKFGYGGVYIQFDQPIDYGTVQAGDLLIDGKPALGWQPTFDDGKTIVFDVTGLADDDGVHTYTLAAGAITTASGAPTALVARTFDKEADGPRVTSTSLAQDAALTAGAPVDVDLAFSKGVMDFYASGFFGFSQFQPASMKVVNLATGQSFTPSWNVPEDARESFTNGFFYTETIKRLTAHYGALPEGAYELRINSTDGGLAATDRFFNPLDGEGDTLPSGDGNPGGDWVRRFTVDGNGVTMLDLKPLAPLGAGVTAGSASSAFSATGDVDNFRVALPAGQHATVVLEPMGGTAQGKITLRDPNGNLVGTGSADAANGRVVLQDLAINSAGVYTIDAESLSGIGGYALRVYVNGVAESETAAHANDGVGTAESLDARFTTVAAGGAARANVIGTLATADDVDVYAITLAAGQALSVAASGIDGGSAVLHLDNAAGVSLAHGSAGALNADQTITDFIAPAAGQYFVRVTGSGRYQILLGRGATIEIERPAAPTDVQNVSTTGVALGRLARGPAANGSAIRVAVTFAENVALTASSPLVDQLNDDTYGNFTAVPVHIGDIDSAAELSAFDVVILANGDFRATGFAAALRAWAEAGGAVVSTGYYAQNAAAYNAGGANTVSNDLNAVIPLQTTTGAQYITGTLVTDTHDPITAGLGNVPLPYYGYTNGGGVDAGAKIVGTVNGSPAVVSALVGLGGRTVFLAPVYEEATTSGDLRGDFGDRLLEQAVIWAAGSGDASDRYAFGVTAGNAVTVTVTPTGADPLPGAALDIYDALGQLVTSGVATSGGTSVTFNAGVTATFTAVVRGTQRAGGDYVLKVTGNTAVAAGPGPSVTGVTPVAGKTLLHPPTTIDVTFDRGIRADSLTTSDLVLSSGTVTGVTWISGTSARFMVSIPDTAGTINLSLAAGAVTDLQGRASQAFGSSFDVDKQGPKVVSRSPQLTGYLPFTAWSFTFNEDIDPTSFIRDDIKLFSLPGDINATFYVVTGVSVSGRVATVYINGQNTPGNYTITFGPHIKDLAGNEMDQDGDGVSGEESDDAFTATTFERFKPAPNLVVTQVGAPATAFSDTDVTVSWTVQNDGDGPTNTASWFDRIYLSTDPLQRGNFVVGEVQNLSFLNNGDVYTATATIHLPRGISGNYYVYVTTDVNNTVAELGHENDNTTASSFVSVQLTPPPDLVIPTLSVPTNAFSEQSIHVSWTGKNQGTGPTLASETQWTDGVYLSRNDEFDPLDQRIGAASHTGGLLPGDTYTAATDVTIPVGSSGSYYIIVVADTYGEVFEHTLDDNNATARPLSVFLTPPPDLVTSLINPPAVTQSSHDVTVNYRVDNTGVGPTPNGAWVDRLWLSKDDVLGGADDILLGQTVHVGALAANAGYSGAVGGTLPDGISGSYHLFVASDADSNVFELNNDNNVAGAPTTVLLLPPDLQSEITASSSAVEAGTALSISYTIRNTGVGDTAVGRWNDYVLLSTDDVADPYDTVLTAVEHNGVVAAGGSYSVNNLSVTMPFNVSPGAYKLIVVADRDSRVYEGAPDSPAEQNNGSPGKAIAVSRREPNLTLTGMTIPSAVQSSDTLGVSWGVVNNGTNRTNVGAWHDRVYLSLDGNLDGNDYFLGDAYHGNSLQIGESYTNSLAGLIPRDMSGDYRVIVVLDNDNLVTEGLGESNNVDVSPGTVHITLKPTPDLVPTSVTIPASGYSGQPVAMSWTVQNKGIGDAPTDASWFDQLYVSEDATLDDGDAVVGYVEHTGGLAVNGSYTVSQDFTLPGGLTGPYYVFVKTDVRDAVYERAREFNNVNDDGANILLSLPAPADLVAGDITIPATASAGQPVTIVYTVTNNGVNPAVGSWADQLYLSTDGTYDINDVPFGRFTHTGGLAVGASYTGTVTANLPGVVPGTYKLIVRSDVRNQVRENDKANNISASVNSVDVSVPSLTLNTPATGSLATGGAVYYRITVDAGQTLNFNFDSAATTGFNELYVRFGQPPSRTQFDQSFTKSLSPDQKISVPDTQAGTYYVLAYANSTPNNAPANYSLTATYLPFGVDELSLKQAGNTGTATFTVHGARFDVYTKLTLERGGVVLKPLWLNLVDETTMQATFDLTGQAIGTYGMHAHSETLSTYIGALDGPDPTSTDIHAVTQVLGDAVLPNALTVVPGVAPRVGVAIVAPGATYGGRGFTFFVDVANDGNVDAPLPSIEVTADGNAHISTRSDVNSDDAQQLQFVPIGLTRKSVLAPGERQTVQLYASGSSTNLGVRNMSRLSGQIDIDALEAYYRDYSDPTWARTWTNFKSLIGPTWTTLHAAMSRIAVKEATLNGEKYVEGTIIMSQLVGLAQDGESLPVEKTGRSDPTFLSDAGMTLVAASHAAVAASNDSNALWSAESRATAADTSGLAAALAADDPEDPNKIKRDPAGNILTGPWSQPQNKDAKFVYKDGIPNTSPNPLQNIPQTIEQLGATAAYARDFIHTLARTHGLNFEDLYLSYLDHYSQDPTTPYFAEDSNTSILDGETLISNGFRTSNITQQIYETNAGFFLTALRHAISTGKQKPEDYKTIADTYVPMLDVLDEKIVRKTLEFSYHDPFELPGLLAGSTGSSDKWGIDRRGLAGFATVKRHVDACGNTTSLDVDIHQRFSVIDTIDFIPGDPGGWLERLLTRSLTILEDHDNAYDQFFNVEFYTPVQHFTIQGSELPDTWHRNKKGLQPPASCPDQDCHKNTNQVPGTNCEHDKSFFVGSIGSVDPNDILGPGGAGTPKFVPKGVPLAYQIQFENQAAATAPTQFIRITQPLSANVDPSTFLPGTIGFSGQNFDVADGRSFFTTRLDLTATRGVYVDVAAGVDAVNHQAFWTFTAIDPATGEKPTDPSVGFLPPDVTAGEGEGFVNYTIMPKASVVTGDRIEAQARIYFDTNAPIDTPLIFNTIDAVAPTSQVEALPTTTGDEKIALKWGGTDDNNASGIARYSIWVSTNDGAYALWLDDTTEQQGTFTGAVGNHYAFYSIATDAAGNVEQPPATADATTAVISLTPAVVGRGLFYNNSYFDGGNVGINASDPLAVATDKTPLLPGGTATFANYTSYDKGINGVYIDMANLPTATTTLTAADFGFYKGNANDTAAWAAAPAPAGITIVRGGGAGGTDRVWLTWADGTIANTWLQVTVNANANTGLPTPDVFYVGNEIGDSGDTAGGTLPFSPVNATDELGARNNPRNLVQNPAPVDFIWDYNRDGKVDATDQIIARNHGTNFTNALRFIAPTGALPPVLGGLTTGLWTGATGILGVTSITKPTPITAIDDDPTVNDDVLAI